MMKSIMCVAFGILLVLVLSTSYAQEAKVEQVQIYGQIKGIVYFNDTFQINEDMNPVRITGVTARHITSETATLAKLTYDNLYQYLEDQEKDRLRQLSNENLIITINARGEDVVAVKFGIIVYDAFKDFLGSLTAVIMDPPNTGMQWNYNPAYLFMFKKYGVVGVFVREARLVDGSIWKFDESFVMSKFSERLYEITKEQIVESDL